jgi:hypothetical protein
VGMASGLGLKNYVLLPGSFSGSSILRLLGREPSDTTLKSGLLKEYSAAPILKYYKR